MHISTSMTWVKWFLFWGLSIITILINYLYHLLIVFLYHHIQLYIENIIVIWHNIILKATTFLKTQVMVKDFEVFLLSNWERKSKWKNSITHGKSQLVVLNNGHLFLLERGIPPEILLGGNASLKESEIHFHKTLRYCKGQTEYFQVPFF